MTFIFLLIGILVGALGGFREAMIMIQKEDTMCNLDVNIDGVRGHESFGYYHRIRVLFLALVSGGSIIIYALDANLLEILLVVWWIWTTFEMFYGIGRWYKPFPKYENVMGYYKVYDDKAEFVQRKRLLLGLLILVVNMRF